MDPTGGVGALLTAIHFRQHLTERTPVLVADKPYGAPGTDPEAATGVAQIAELFWQLRNETDGRQVPDGSLALQYHLGGP